MSSEQQGFLRGQPPPAGSLGPLLTELRDEQGNPQGVATNPLHVDVGADLNVNVAFESKVSTLNSRGTPLAANEVFTGSWEECVDFGTITAVINTDAPSVNKGARIQFSPDASMVSSERAGTILANVPAYFSLQPEAKFFRIVYTNGPTAQTWLIEQVKLHFAAMVPQGPLAAQTDDLTLVTPTQAHLKARVFSGPAAGAWVPLGTDGAGNLQVTQDTASARETTLEAMRADLADGLSVTVSNPTTNPETGLAKDATVVELRDRFPLAAALADAVNPAALSRIGSFGHQWNGSSWDRLRGDVTNGLDVDVTRLPNTPVRTHEEIVYYATAAGGRLAFNITTGLLTFSVTGEQPLGALTNPAGSGRDIFLDVGEFGSSANTTFRRFRGGTLSLTGGGIAPVNTSGGAATSPLRFYVGGSSPTFTVTTPGTVSKTAHIAAFQQYVTELKGRTVLRPGQTIYWTIVGPGGLTGTMTAAIFFEFYDLPAAA